MQNTCVAFRISYSAGFKGVQTLEIFNLSTEYTQLQNHQLQKLTGLGINSVGCFQLLTISFYFQAFGLIIVTSEYTDLISLVIIYINVMKVGV